MDLFCKVQEIDGVKQVVEGPGFLPQSEGNISNFYIISDLAFLKSYGWLPYEKVTEDKEIFVSSSIEVLEDKVIETVITRDKTEEEKKIEEWQIVREKRDSLLLSSDINVLADKWEKLTAGERDSISKYRQALRDLPQTNKNPFKIKWPVKP